MNARPRANPPYQPGRLRHLLGTLWPDARRIALQQGGFLQPPENPGTSVIVGRSGRDFIYSPGPRPVTGTGPERSGKSVSLVMPNLLNWKGAVVALCRPTAEADISTAYRRMLGQQVFRFAPGEAASCSWNPLDMVRHGHHSGDLAAIAQALYPDHEQVAGLSLFMGLALYLLETGADRRGFNLSALLALADSPWLASREQLQTHLGMQQISPACRMHLDLFAGAGEDQPWSLLSFKLPLLAIGPDVLARCMTTSDFDLRDMARQPFTLFVEITPFQKGLRCLQQLMLLALARQGQGYGMPCLVVVDDFMTTRGRPLDELVYLPGMQLLLIDQHGEDLLPGLHVHLGQMWPLDPERRAQPDLIRLVPESGPAAFADRVLWYQDPRFARRAALPRRSQEIRP